MACQDCTRLVGTGLKNRALRRELLIARLQADRLFNELCNDTAVDAFRELWRSGHFQCDPQDYEFIIDMCIAAIRKCGMDVIAR